jgi:hypothetical protein
VSHNGTEALNGRGAVVDLRIGEVISFDCGPGDIVSIDRGRIVLLLEQKSGQLARLRIIAERHIRIEIPRRAQAIAG